MRKMYIVTPAGVYTGGPTALFQLCHSLNEYFNVNAIISFTGVKEDVNPVHPNYMGYKCKWIPISKVDDDSRNLLVLPETQTYLLKKFKNLRKAIYWLSVDNFILNHYFSSRVPKILFYKDFFLYVLRYGFTAYRKWMVNDVRHYIACREILNAIDKRDEFLKFLNEVDLHIAQSLYAKNFIIRLGIDESKVCMLREPIEEEFLNTTISFNEKEDVITFNARKSFSIVYRALSKVKLWKKHVTIFALRNIGRENMIKILKKSKVFVDVGHHPGRDRPFREAGALCNVVIINRDGGYYYFDDCPVPDNYAIKCNNIACRDININYLTSLIIDCLENYEHHIKNFHELMNYIKMEPKLYLNDLEKLLSFID